MKQKILAGKKLEWLVLALFVVAYCAVSAFHEPWFDEAQSWQIAKCDSILKMLFYTPHYEGNPPLWYLILAIPAKAGVPFELGLKTVGLMISVSAVFLLEYKSPFPRLFKLLLPFTYFFFYQYGIIVRPYGLMILAYIVLAIYFKKRNEKPWIFVLSLALLCETSSFCIVISGGIAVCWLYEILREWHFRFRRIARDSRIHALSFLFIFALFLVYTILPSKDASFLSIWDRQNSIPECFLLGMTTFLSETLLITSPWFSNDQTVLTAAKITIVPLISCVLIQTLILLLICCFSKKENLKFFFVPYICFCLFGSVVFLGGHHLGIGYFLLFFWLWINCEDEGRFEIGNKLAFRLQLSDKDKTLLRKSSLGVCIISVAVSLIWTGLSTYQEIRLQYSYGRETARYLEETGLVNAKIAISWLRDSSNADPSDSEIHEVDYSRINTKSYGWPVPICAYEQKNIIYNFNDGRDDSAYTQFQTQTPEQNMRTVEHWKTVGTPDVLLGEVDVGLLTDGSVSIKDYSPVYTMEINYIWKGNVYKGRQYLFLRNDLLAEYAQTPIERPAGIFGNASIEIMDELRERYKNGEDINELLKPYLDYLFGEESG